MREYNLKKYYIRRKTAIEKLGGKCVKCGETENLEIDHINPKTKEFGTAKLWSCSEDRFWKEIGKCQLLCTTHHIEKSIFDLGNKPAKGTHGTISSYRYCKCELCVEAKHETNRKYNERRNELRRQKRLTLIKDRL